MSLALKYIIICLTGYLSGCINPAFIISKLKGVDLREEGSKNLGTSNVTMVLGLKLGLVTLFYDVMKAFIIVFLFKHFFFLELAYGYVLGGLFAVVGHIFPFYLKFKGGKGFASYLGLILGLNWKFFILLCLAILIVCLISNYIVMGTMTCAAVAPFFIYFKYGWIPCLVAAMISIIIAIKHDENFRRIFIEKTEPKLLKVLFK